MEPNTSSSPAAWTTSHAAALEHGEPSSVRDASLLSPAFSAAPLSPGGLVPAPGSGSGSSWYQQQIPPPSPPAPVAVGNGSPLSVHAHATSSSSSHSVPSSSFPTADAFPMVGYDLFGSPESTTAATPLPTQLSGGQWQGESSPLWAAAPVLPECPSPEGMFGFAGESAAWPCEDTSSFFSPSSSAGGLVPQSSDDLVGFVQQSSDSDELEALLQSFRMPTVEESLVDAQMTPVEEEEEIGVSAFLVADPVDQLPNALRTASPQMAGSGGGASASWMVPENTGNNWPPTLPPPAASTCTMVSTSSASMACHSGGVARSIVGAMMKPSSSVLPSSQGAGASSSNFNGFAQPSSSSVLAPHAPNLQGPLLPVKQEIIDVDVDVDATARRHPDFISLDDDDDEDGFYQEANFGSWGTSSWPGSPSFVPGSWGGGGSNSPSFAPGSWGSSSVSPGFAPGNWGGGGRSSSPGFAPGNWGGGGRSSSPSFGPGSWGEGSSRRNPSFSPSSWGGGGSRSPSFDGSMRCFDQSMSTDNYGSSSLQKPIRGKMASISGLPPLPKSDVRAASSSNGVTGMFFTDAEMAIIAREKKLQELLKTDAKKVKRMLYNRVYSATAKVRKVMHTKNLERMIVTLEERRKSLCEELQSLQEGSAVLKAQQMEMQMLIGELEKQTRLKDVVREGLRADIQHLKHLKLN